MAGSEKFVLPLRRGLTGYALAAALTPVLAILRGQAAAAIAESEAARPIADADRMRNGAARSGQPRPAHAAGRGEGGGQLPALD